MKRLLYFLRRPLQLPVVIITKLPYFRFIKETRDYQNRVNFEFWFKQKIMNWGGNRKVYWPVHWTSIVYDPENILVGVDAYPGIMNGCYIQGIGGITIGDFTQIAPNVAIVSANHDLYDSRKHIPEPVVIGKHCWIGAGAKIMPGVTLGDWTIVGAGAVVTKSYSGGYCVLGGIPARIIKELDREKCIPYSVKKRYRGYISEEKFEAYCRKKLKV